MAEDARDAGALVQRASEGDAGAVEELLERYLPGLRAYVRDQAGELVRAKDQSADIVQSVCREVLERLADERLDYRGEEEFKHWLFRAAQLKLMNRHRYWKAEKRDAAREQAAPPPGESGTTVEALFRNAVTPSQDAELREELARFRKAFGRLSERDREIVRLAHLDGLAHREIAARLGITENHSRQLLHRALVRLSRPGLGEG